MKAMLSVVYASILDSFESCSYCGDQLNTRTKNLIRAEIVRLSKLCQYGWFTLLHHQGLLERSECLSERVRYIVMHKPSHQILIRLRHIRDANALVYRYNAKHNFASDSAVKWTIPTSAVLKLIPKHRWSEVDQTIKGVG
jgi:hypothetical protein